MAIIDRLYELQDREYAEFQSKLTPSVEPEFFIGVRVPALRKLAKELAKRDAYFKQKAASGIDDTFVVGEAASFLQELPHKYYEENMLHGFLLAEIKDYDMCIAEVERFLPFVDNWAVSDTMSPKVFAKHKEELLVKIREWIASDKTYTCRFGICMLMRYFLDEDFKDEYLALPAAVHSEEYYVKMMVAWYFATALAKQWDATVPYIEQGKLDKWVHNKTIQKARESFRVTDEHKECLKALRK